MILFSDLLLIQADITTHILMMEFRGFFTTLLLTSLILLMTSELSEVQAVSTRQFNNFKKAINAKCAAANNKAVAAQTEAAAALDRAEEAEVKATAAENRAILAEARGILLDDSAFCGTSGSGKRIPGCTYLSGQALPRKRRSPGIILMNCHSRHPQFSVFSFRES